MKKLKTILKAIAKYGGWIIAAAQYILERLDIINV
jgi:hypothetical protein